jgi:hypothetical protein
MKCPRCGSTHIARREVGKRTGAAVVGMSAAALGTISAMRGAQIGMTVGVVAGPFGAATGGLLGALVAGLFAGSAGCAVGSLVGSLADTNFLDNRACLDCGHLFRDPSDAPAGVNVNITATAQRSDAPHASPHPYPAAGAANQLHND